MNKILNAVILLLSLSIMCSCTKTESETQKKSKMIGTWRLSSFEFYFDGKLLRHGPDDSIFIIDEDSSKYCIWDSMDYFAALFDIVIKNDYSVYVMGQYLGSLEDEDIDLGEIKIIDGNMVSDEEYRVYGYGMTDELYEYPSEWEGLDGYLHKFVYRTIYSPVR